MAETAEERARLVVNEVDQLLMQRDYESSEIVVKRAIRAAEAAARADQCEECAKMLEALVDGKLSDVAEATRAAAGVLRAHGMKIAGGQEPTA